MKRLLFALSFLLAGTASAATYYVSVTGSGTTCSVGSPATWAYVTTQSGGLNPTCGGVRIAGGDTILVQPSATPYTGVFNISTTGTAGNPVIFKCNVENEFASTNCKFDQLSPNAADGSQINSTGSYQRFQNFEVYGTGCAKGTSPFSGTVSTNGTTAITRASGTSFNSAWALRGIIINSNTYVIMTVTDADHITLDRAVPTSSTYSATVGDAGCRATNDNILNVSDVSHPNDSGKNDGFSIDQNTGNHPGIEWVNNYVHDVRACFSPNNAQSIGEIISGNTCLFQGWYGGLNPGAHGPALYIQNYCGFDPLVTYHCSYSALNRPLVQYNMFAAGFGQEIQYYAGQADGHSNVDFVSNFLALAGKAFLYPALYCGTVNCVDYGNSRNFQVGSFYTAGGYLNGNIIFQHSTAWGCCSTDFHFGWNYCVTGHCPATTYDFTITNNLIFGPVTWDGYPPSGTFSYTGNESYKGNPYAMATDYASGNTWWTSIPTTIKSKGPLADPYEPGRCRIFGINFPHSASTTYDLTACGMANGTNYRIINLFNPTAGDWATGTYNSASPTITLTLSGITYGTPYGANVAPTQTEEFAFVILPTAGGAATPTPTRTSTATNTPTNTATRTNTPTLTPSRTVTPTPSLTPQFTNTRTFTPSNTPTPSPTPAAGVSFSVHQCTAASPFVITADASLIGGYYARAETSTADSGTLTCTFTLPYDGIWRMWVLVNAPDSNTDSAWISVDADTAINFTPTPASTPGPAHIFDMLEQVQPCNPNSSGDFCIYDLTAGGTTRWQILTDRSQSCGQCSPQHGTERQLNLTAGSHTIVFRNREVSSGAGAKIIYIRLTQDMSYDPGSPNPTPTPTPGLCKRYIRCHQKAGWKSYPCNMIQGTLGRRPEPCPWQ